MLLNVICIYLFVSIIVTTFFAAFIQSRSKADYVKAAVLLCLAINVYMFGYAMELSVPMLEQKLFWNHVQYFGIPFVSALWLSVALIYTNKLSLSSVWKIVLVYAIPFLTFAFRLTNNVHHLYFASESLQQIGTYSYLIKEKGIWLYVQGFHSLALIITTLVINVNTFVGQKGRDRVNVVYMLGASGFAVLGLLLNLLNVASFDYMILFLPVAVVLVVLAIIKNDLWEAKALARDIIFEKSDEGMILINKKGRIFDFNKNAKTMLAHRGILLRKESVDIVFAGVGNLSDLFNSPQEYVWMVKVQDGFRYYCLASVDILHSSGSLTGRLITIRDITQMQLLHNRLKIQATTDELSGLLNRRAFTDLCESRLNDRRMKNGSFYLLMIDIDMFKNINDTYGHIIGDHVIEKLGALFRQSFRSTDLIARLGGEEFTVFMQAHDCNIALKKAEQFRETVARSYMLVDDERIHITVSIGLVGTDSEPQNITELMNKADKALYVSKNNGRNRTSVYGSPFDPTDVFMGYA